MNLPRPPWTPSPALATSVVAGVAVVLTLGVWQLARAIAGDALEGQLRSISAQVGGRIEGCVESRIAVLGAVGTAPGAGALAGVESHRAQADVLLVGFDGYQAINWVDADGVIRIVHPVEGNEPALGRSLLSHPVAGPFLAEVKRTGETQVTAPLELLQGGQGFATYVPVKGIGGETLGFINGVFRSGRLVEQCLGSEPVEGFEFRLSDDGQPIYSSVETWSQPNLLNTSALPLFNRTWTLELAPTPALVERVEAPATVALVVGLSGAVLLALLTLTLTLTRRRAAERGHAQELLLTRLGTVIDATEDVIGIADMQGEVVYFNPAAQRLTGHRQTVPHEARMGDDIAPEDSAAARAHIKRVLATGSDQAVLRIMNRETGERVPVEFSTFVVRRSDGRALAIATVGRDLRERRRLEHELQQAQKMEALGRLAGGVAHDFNNLLTVIISNATLLADTAALAPSAAPVLEDLIEASERAAELTAQLMSLGRSPTTEREPLDLEAFILGLRGLFDRLIPEDVELETDLTPGCQVLWHRVQVEQVILNLVMNAVEAMPQGGTLRLGLHADGDDEVHLVVEDTGLGMDESTRRRIFEPFYSTKSSSGHSGAGLGLATVYGHVRQMGGRVLVDSTPGHGTRFTLILPRHLAVDGGADEHPAGPTGTPSPTGPLRVLVVEDELPVRETLMRLLENAGYPTIEARHGQEALDLLEAGAEVDVIISDVVMPVLGGAELTSRVREAWPALPIVLMSGHAGDRLDHLDLQEDVDGFLAKPFSASAILTAVRRAVEERRDKSRTRESA